MREPRQLLAIWRKLSVTPGGKRLFARLICFETPWVVNIRPVVANLQPGRVEVTLHNRRNVLDHAGNIHATAQCTLAELAAHLVARVTMDTPRQYRTVDLQARFLQPGHNHLTATAQGPATDASSAPGEHIIPVAIRDTASTVVSEFQVTLHNPPGSGTRVRKRTDPATDGLATPGRPRLTPEYNRAEYWAPKPVQ